jgi:hypothetical protein
LSDTILNLLIFAGCMGTTNDVLSNANHERGEGMSLKFEAPKIRDLNGNSGLLIDVPRARVPLAPPPVSGIDEFEDVIAKHVQQGVDIAKHVQQGVDPTGEIQRLLRLLTHRQMRQLCQKLANGKDTIASSELADAFDRFAYEE